MKRMFIKMLPVMAAVLLATSCSKEDGNDAVIDTSIDNGTPQVEAVDNGIKTITITGKLSKESLSKVYVSDNTDRTLKFNGNETFAFGTEGEGNVYGTIAITKDDGTYTATLNFPNKDALTAETGFTATHGTDPSVISEGYANLATAVNNAYYTIDFIVKESGGTYSLKDKTNTESDIKVNVKSAFIEAQTSKTITVNDDASVSVEEGKFYVVSSTATMGKDKKTITSGKIYKVKAASSVPDGYVDLGVVNAKGEHVYFAESNSEESTWNAINEAGKLDELPTKKEWVALANACYWVWSESPKGMYVYKLRDGQTSNYTARSFNNDRNYSPENDPSYIFLPVRPGYSYSYYWSSTEYEDGTGSAYCLLFGSDIVGPEDGNDESNTRSVRTVRRSK